MFGLGNLDIFMSEVIISFTKVFPAFKCLQQVLAKLWKK